MDRFQGQTQLALADIRPFDQANFVKNTDDAGQAEGMQVNLIAEADFAA
jgi:hypothetical protein